MTETLQSGVDRAIAAAGSRKALFERMGVTPQALQKFVDKGYFPIPRAEQVSEWYGIPVADLVAPDVARLMRNA